MLVCCFRVKNQADPDVSRTRSLLIWSQTRYHCATESTYALIDEKVSVILTNKHIADDWRLFLLDQTTANHALLWETAKDPGDEFWRQNKANMAKHKNFNFRAYHSFINSISLQLNGMLMMWKLQQAMQDDPIWTARIHRVVHRGNRAEVFIWQNFQPAYRDLGKQPTLWYEHIANFTKDLEVRWDLGNRASPVNKAHMKRPLVLVGWKFCHTNTSSRLPLWRSG